VIKRPYAAPDYSRAQPKDKSEWLNIMAMREQLIKFRDDTPLSAYQAKFGIPLGAMCMNSEQILGPHLQNS